MKIEVNPSLNSDRRENYKKLFSLAFLVVLGGILRFYQLGHQSFWYDEYASLRQATLPFIQSILNDTNHPPFHDLLEWIWIRIFGMNEFAVRSISVIFGILTIPLVYLLGRKLYGSRVGFISGFLMALSPFHIYFSQEARMYSPVIFFTALSSWLLIEFMENQNWKTFVGYLLSGILGLYTFYLFALTLLSHNIFFLVQKKYPKNWKIWLSGQSVICFLFLPWLIYLLNHLGDQTRGYAEGFIYRIPFLFYTYSMGYSGFLLNYMEKLHLVETIRQNATIIGLTFLVFGISGISGLFVLFRKYFRYEGLYLLVNLFFPIFTLICLWKVVPLLSERYLSFICIFYYLLIALGIGFLPKKWMQYLLLLMVSILSIYSLKIYYFHPLFGKEQWKDVAYYIQQNEKPGDILLFHKDFTAGTFNYYYQGNLNKFGIPERAVSGKQPQWVEIKPILQENRMTRLGERKRYNLPFISNSTSPTPPEMISKNNNSILSLFKEYDGIWFIESQNFDTKNFYPDLLNKYFVKVSYQLFPKMNGIHVYYFRNNRTNESKTNLTLNSEKNP